MVLLFCSFFFLVIRAALTVNSDGFQQFYINRQINPLISYGDVTLFRYTIPHEIVSAKWNLLPSISSNSCESREAVFVIRWQGYPLVNLNPLSEPTRTRNDLLLDTSEQYEVIMKTSDTKPTTFSLNNPLPGIWLAFAYFKPPKYHRRIKGEINFFEDCKVNLSTHLSFETLKHDQRPITLLTDDLSSTRTIDKKQFYKFYVPMDISSVQMVFNCSEARKISQSDPVIQNNSSYINHSACFLEVFLRRQALPSSKKYDHFLDCSLAKEQEKGCVISGINATRNNWNYVLVVRKSGENRPESDQVSLNVSITLNSTRCTFVPIQSSSLSSLISSPFDNSDQHMNSNSIDDLDSQQDPTIFSSFIKREAGTSDLRYNNIMKFGKAPKLMEEKPSLSENNAQQCPLTVNLVRYDHQGPFSFEYDYIHPVEGENWNRTSGSEYFDIQSDMHKGLDQLESNNNISTKISVLSFQIVPLMDSGGSLTLNLTIKQGSNYSFVNSNNVSVEACINYDHYSHQTDNCLHKVAVNSSHLHENSVRIPYPRAGRWFVTFKSDCYYVVGSERLQYIPSGCKQNTTSIQFSIKSHTCSDQDCGKHGKCSVSVQDGLSFSTCSCSSGWKGIDCGDDSSALDEREILLQFLLLTLSNVVFIPVLILALYRKLFTEAFLYLVVMASSILHHACDSDSEQSFCLIKSDLLRYIDHYSILLAFWVTLITLSNLPQKVQTFLHLVGSFCLAVAVEVDGSSLKTLLIPIILGFTIVTLTWFLFCVTKKSCFPSYQLWLLSMIPGLILTATGLVAHCLFETKEYYPVVHSFWHVLMASALLFLIPTTEKEVKTEEEEDYRLKGKMYLLVSSYESRTDGPTYVTTRDANIIQKLRALRIIEEPLKFTNYNCYNYKFEYPDICVLDWFQLLGYRVQTMAMTYDPDVSCIKHIWTMYV